MICPNCGNRTKVCDTRFDQNENEIFRKRMCKTCSHEFFTVEFEIEKTNKFVTLWKTLMRCTGGSKT